MAITRTAKGTNATKASGTSLSINDIALVEGSQLVVGIAYDNAQGPPSSIKWGNRDLTEIIKQQNVGTGLTVAIWKIRYIHHPGTRDLVATWSGSITERAMFATMIEGASNIDVSQSNQVDASTSPATGTAVTTTVANTIHIAAFAAQGPDNDTPATAGVGHTIGQRIGMSGVPATSNCTLQETYESLTATGNCRATLTVTTARDFAAVIVAFKPRQVYTVIDAYQRLWITDTDADKVILRVESETSNDVFEVRIDVDLFDVMTDQEVTDYITKSCAWHAAHVLDDELVAPETDSTRDTRLATFVNDTVTI